MFPVIRDKLKDVFKHGDVVLMRSDSIIYGVYKSWIIKFIILLKYILFKNGSVIRDFCGRYSVGSLDGVSSLSHQELS